MNRKDFLKKIAVSSLGISSFSSITQNNLWSADEAEIEDITIPSKVKSVIFIEMMGGMSHVDTLDPKPNSVFSQTESSLRGISVLEPFSKTARQLGNFGLVRSTWSEEGDHAFGQFLLQTGYRQTEAMGFPDIPSIGSVIAFAKKSKNKGPYFPHYVSMGNRGGKMGHSGFLGIPYASYHISNFEDPILHLNPSVGKFKEDRLGKRKDLLSALNEEFSRDFQSQSTKEWSNIYRAAEEFRNSKDLDSFRIQLESDSTKSRYGSTWQGKAFLLAKRLAQKEVPFIHIGIGGWDTHTNNKSQITKIMSETDQGLAALLEDLHQTGLIDQTVFVLSSEFGRTPDVGTRDGRDHHPRVWTSILGGGPFPRGFLYGSSDELGQRFSKPDEAMHVRDLVATIYNAVGIDTTASIVNSFGRPFRLTTKLSKVRKI